MTRQYNGRGLKKTGFRVQFPDGTRRRVASRAKALALIAERGLTQAECRLLRIGRSRNGAPVDSPVAW